MERLNLINPKDTQKENIKKIIDEFWGNASDVEKVWFEMRFKKMLSKLV